MPKQETDPKVAPKYTLESLYLRTSYTNSQKFKMEVKFVGYNNEVKLDLPHDIGIKIFEICSDELQAAIQQSMQDILGDFERGITQIDGNSNPLLDAN